MRTLIVDDEPLARERVRTVLAGEADIDIVGEAEDGLAAVSAIGELQPDLVVLDVQMPGLDGFDVVRAVGAGAMPTVIFVTAYDEFAVRAFEVNAVDYVLKPVNPARLKEAVERARSRVPSPRADIDALLALLQQSAPRYTDRLVANDGSTLELVWVRQIDWIEAAGNYTNVHAGGSVHRVRQSMTTLQEQLDPAMFVRIHRSVIVNLRAVQNIQPLYQGDYLVLLRDGRRLTSTRTYRRTLLAAFGRNSE